MYYEQDPHQLEVYLETRRRRLFVGNLVFNTKIKQFTFTYDLHYLQNNSAIALGPELAMTKITYVSKKLFPTFLDRIPSRENPAYKEYCLSQHISPKETNPIILLTTIGRRGPSAFIFEAVFQQIGSIAADLKRFREKLELTRWDVAMLFDMPELSIYKIETEKNQDSNMLRLIHYYLIYPQISLDQINLTGKKVHRQIRTKVYRYFKNKIKA